MRQLPDCERTITLTTERLRKVQLVDVGVVAGSDDKSAGVGAQSQSIRD
jgi:hypothetical protein